jgi:hypothetical protein
MGTKPSLIFVVSRDGPDVDVAGTFAGALAVVPVESGGLPTQPLSTTEPAAETAAAVKNFRLE